MILFLKAMRVLCLAGGCFSSGLSAFGMDARLGFVRVAVNLADGAGMEGANLAAITGARTVPVRSSSPCQGVWDDTGQVASS